MLEFRWHTGALSLNLLEHEVGADLFSDNIYGTVFDLMHFVFWVEIARIPCRMPGILRSSPVLWVPSVPSVGLHSSYCYHRFLGPR